jgi:hypothetical protein
MMGWMKWKRLVRKNRKKRVDREKAGLERREKKEEDGS